jgi:hypothetical protein
MEACTLPQRRRGRAGALRYWTRDPGPIQRLPAPERIRPQPPAQCFGSGRMCISRRVLLPPFDDGNARSAFLAALFVLAREGIVLENLGTLRWFSFYATDPEDARGWPVTSKEAPS